MIPTSRRQLDLASESNESKQLAFVWRRMKKTSTDKTSRHRATKQQRMTALATQVQTSYMAMYSYITPTSGALAPTAAPFTLADTGPRIQQMNKLILPCLQRLMELDRVLNQEIAYQQNILHLHLQQQPAARQVFFPLLTNFRMRMANVANLLNGRTTALVLATTQPRSDTENWAGALRRKVIQDLIQPHPMGTAAALASLPPDVTPQTQRLVDYTDDLRALHSRFQQHLGLLAQNNATARLFNADGSLTPSQNVASLPAVPRLRLRQGGVLAASRPAAIRELSRLREGPLKRLVSETLRQLAPFFGGGLPLEQGVVGLAQRREVLMDRARLTLRNEAQARLDRREAAREMAFVDLRALGGGGQQADDGDRDATPAELQARILDMATVAGDRVFLTRAWTVQTIQETIDTTTAELESGQV